LVATFGYRKFSDYTTELQAAHERNGQNYVYMYIQLNFTCLYERENWSVILNICSVWVSEETNTTSSIIHARVLLATLNSLFPP
jgi:hypothetical protein